MVSEIPKNLQPCNPSNRLFPIEWRESYYRRLFDMKKGGYVCPACKKVYKPDQFKLLHGHHKLKWAKGGKTVWKNFELRCSQCNTSEPN